MTIVNIPVQGGLYKLGYKWIAATADTLPITNNDVGDRAFIYDGDDKYWDGDSWQADTAPTLGSVIVSSQSLPVTSTTAVVTQVGDSASNVTLKAANTSRKGLAVYNNSSAILYLKLGATAVVATSWTVAIPANGYWEMGSNIYNGIVDGIWASDAGGNALVTEW